MPAICPKCQTELPSIGSRCPNDGWFGVSPSDLATNNNIIGRLLGESFVPLRKIGQGGMGTVYEGRQIQFERVVAIKVLSKLHLTDPQIIARFEREAKSVARVVHPNVVQLIDSGVESGDIAYIVMEYVKGVELSSVPPSELSGRFIVHVTQQILNALAEAHSMNVIHRDLKPDNIMLTQEDGDNYFVKVLDFGLAALTDRAKITMSGQALGTPWYMSPEQATATKVTAASDIYSLGCILYELASSKPPFPGNRPFNVMMQHVNAQVPPLVLRPEVKLSSGMIQFILKCLEKNPADRYLTAKDALEALYQLPEWVDAAPADPTQSLKMSMMQLSEMSRMQSDVTNVASISANLEPTDVHVEQTIQPSSGGRSLSTPIPAAQPRPASHGLPTPPPLPSSSSKTNMPAQPAQPAQPVPSPQPAQPSQPQQPPIPVQSGPVRLDPNIAFRRMLFVILAIMVILIVVLIYLLVH